jgi:hypothetical protein
MSIEAGRQDERLDSTLALRLEHGEGVVRNVSASGIYFVTDVALKNGAPVKFTVEFRNFPGGPIQVECNARIVRVDEQGEKRGVAARIDSLEFFRVRKPEAQRC